MNYVHYSILFIALSMTPSMSSAQNLNFSNFSAYDLLNLTLINTQGALKIVELLNNSSALLNRTSSIILTNSTESIFQFLNQTRITVVKDDFLQQLIGSLRNTSILLNQTSIVNISTIIQILADGFDLNLNKLIRRIYNQSESVVVVSKPLIDQILNLSVNFRVFFVNQTVSFNTNKLTRDLLSPNVTIRNQALSQINATRIISDQQFINGISKLLSNAVSIIKEALRKSLTRLILGNNNTNNISANSAADSVSTSDTNVSDFINEPLDLEPDVY